MWAVWFHRYEPRYVLRLIALRIHFILYYVSPHVTAWYLRWRSACACIRSLPHYRNKNQKKPSWTLYATRFKRINTLEQVWTHQALTIFRRVKVFKGRFLTCVKIFSVFIISAVNVLSLIGYFPSLSNQDFLKNLLAIIWTFSTTLLLLESPFTVKSTLKTFQQRFEHLAQSYYYLRG